MGSCIYCDTPAGFLRRSHAECRRGFKYGASKIITLIENAAGGSTSTSELVAEIEMAAAESFIGKPRLRALVVAGWEKAVVKAFEDGVISKEEETRLGKLIEHFALSQGELDENGSYTRLVKGCLLRDVLEGNLPDRVSVVTGCPVNLQRGEKLVWMFGNVKYRTFKTVTRSVGGSQGISVRIARGMYYRTGAFESRRVHFSEDVIDTGIVVATNRHIYFAGGAKRFRVPYDKIICFEPFADGIGIQRDAETAKPEFFATGDGWFTYNLLTNLAQLG